MAVAIAAVGSGMGMDSSVEAEAGAVGNDSFTSTFVHKGESRYHPTGMATITAIITPHLQ
jgi:hypothetical protein